MNATFENRYTAGKRLAEALLDYRNEPGLLVLGLPRGGVPVAYEIAHSLNAELDVLVVRKLGVPYQPELAMGAIASAGARFFNEDVIRASGLKQEQIESVIEEQQAELVRREKAYRGDKPPLAIEGRTAIVVDDGIATGASIQVAVMALRSLNPAKIAVAVPVAPIEGARRLTAVADEFICLLTPTPFYAVGQWYRDFRQTTDDEVRELLEKAQTEWSSGMHPLNKPAIQSGKKQRIDL
jgi:putative phosphoribosyl transferase